MAKTTAFLAGALLAAGCQADGDLVTDPSLGARMQAVQTRMHERFGSAKLIEQAIARSDLQGARFEARKLASLDEPEVLAAWRPYFERVSVSARQVELAPDVVDAARAMATLGRDCARCHEAAHARIAFRDEPRPAIDVKLRPQMLGHQWAAARMWEGLIGPSEERWLEGAHALSQLPLAIVAEEGMTVARADNALHDGLKIEDDVARVRLYATRALAPHDQSDRTAIFGDMLATCAHCHAAIRDR